MDTQEEKLKQFLELFWLRPENGLLCTFKSEAFKHLSFESPSLDISCGDGLFMYIHQGGSFEKDFDYFRSTNSKNFKHSSFVDIYDHFEEGYEVKTVNEPKTQIDYGIDWKKSLINKAEKLNLYKNLIVHDNNNLPLPFDDNFFQTIYSNSIYWVKNVDELIHDIYRILKPGGVAVLEVATPNFHQTLNDLEAILSKEAIELLDRNRRDTNPSLYFYNDWKQKIESTGFKIENVTSAYPNRILIDIWNIGLRPISHLLVQMAQNLNDEDLVKIKMEWVDIFYKLFKPLLNIESSHDIEDAAYLSFTIRK